MTSVQVIRAVYLDREINTGEALTFQDVDSKATNTVGKSPAGLQQKKSVVVNNLEMNIILD